jgi:hypothetical protein
MLATPARGTRAIRLGLALAVTVSPAAHAQRRITDFGVAKQAPLWLRLDADGTTLGNPNWHFVRNGRVYITDWDGPAVLALDARTGALLWRYAKEGSGPGEFRHPAFVVWHPRGIVVVDNSLLRLYLFSEDGRLLSEQTTPHGLSVDAVCSLDDGSMIISTVVLRGSPLFRVRFGERAAQPFPFPFDTAVVHPMHLAVDLAAAPSVGCLIARKVTAGMAMLSRSGPGVPRSFIESPKERGFKPSAQIRDTSDLPIQFAQRTGVTGRTAFVWFGGTKCDGRCIDFYSLPDLRYLHTIRIQGRTGINMNNLDIEGDLVVMLGSRDDIPLVAAYRLPRPRAR